MVKTRLVLLVTIAALVAPWVAPCLAAAPVDHAAMPCCRSSEPDEPAARPCCAPAGEAPAVPASSAASLAHPAPVAIVWTSALLTAQPLLHVHVKPLISIHPRVLSGVLLI